MAMTRGFMAGLQDCRSEGSGNRFPSCNPATLQCCNSASVTCTSCGSCAGRSSWWRCSALALIARPYLHGLSFVIRAAEMQGTAAARRRLRHDARHRARDRDPDATRTDARAALRAGRLACTRGAADLGPSRVGHRRAAARAAGAADRREPHRGRHARHPGALALRDRAGDHRRDRGRGRLARRPMRRSRPIARPR